MVAFALLTKADELAMPALYALGLTMLSSLATFASV